MKKILIDSDELVTEHFIEMLDDDWIAFHDKALLFGFY
ncbi:hypothetical protein D031_4684 [Vibrio parahaemolyticus VP-48]|nr:hypothetical protein D031_4684 [Vibrio parahaemolyticus VP-48]